MLKCLCRIATSYIMKRGKGHLSVRCAVISSVFLSNNSTKSLGQHYLKLKFCLSDAPRSLCALVYFLKYLDQRLDSFLL